MPHLRNVRPLIDEIAFTSYGKLLFVIVAFLYAQAYALNNLVPALIATMVLGYASFARMCFNEQLMQTKLAATRHSKTRVFQDRPFSASLEIFNGSSCAMWVDIEDEPPAEAEVASGEIRRREVIEPHTSKRLSYFLRPLVRGKLILDGYRVRLMDERGIMSVAIEGNSERVIEVQPPIDKFKGGEILMRREHISMVGMVPSKRLGRGYEFGGIRQYEPDDSSSSIEWKSSARLAKLMTKLMCQDTRMSIYFFLDCSRSMRFTRTHGDKSKLDQSVYMAVQLMTRLNRGGFPVGLGIYNEHRILDFEPPSHGRLNRADLLRMISRIPGSKVSSTWRLGEGLGKGEPKVRRAGMFISRILPFFGRRGVDSSERASGIYAVVERLVLDKVKSGVAVIFSDLEVDSKSMMLSCQVMLRRGHHTIIITPFSPSFELNGEVITVEVLEKAYLSYQAKVVLMRRLERMGVHVIEIEHGKEAAVEVSRRLSMGV